MGIYRQIMEIANCSLDQARVIRNAIDADWALDWSECTQSEFQAVVTRYAKVGA